MTIRITFGDDLITVPLRVLFYMGLFALTASPLAAAAQHDHSKSSDISKKTVKTAVKPPLKPAEGASIKIMSPTNDQVFKGNKVPIQFKLNKGKRGHHAHAYVDGELGHVRKGKGNSQWDQTRETHVGASRG